MLRVSHAVEVLVLGLLVVVYKIPYSSCIFNAAVVVACVIFTHGFSRCRRYWIWVFCCLFQKNWSVIVRYVYTYKYEFYSSKKSYWLRTASSTRNGKFKNLEPHFQVSATRSIDGRRSRKLIVLRHTHGSAPRSPYLPCEILDQWKSSELEQNDGISYSKNWEIEVDHVMECAIRL